MRAMASDLETRGGAAFSPETMLRLDALAATPLETKPYDYVFVPGFVSPEAFPRVVADFPKITRGGSYPLSHAKGGPAFDALVAALESPATARVVGDKFGLDLTGLPTMITARGRTRAVDGSIHTDTATKVLTLLIYLNEGWSDTGGRLRVLNGPTDIDDFAIEVPPIDGNLLIFRRSERSFHGHLPFNDRRRSMQMNWMTDVEARDRELKRHQRSAWLKKLSL